MHEPIAWRMHNIYDMRMEEEGGNLQSHEDVFLELLVVAELELPCGFLQAFIEDLDVFLLSQEFLDPDGAPCAPERETPLTMMYA